MSEKKNGVREDRCRDGNWYDARVVNKDSNDIAGCRKSKIRGDHGSDSRNDFANTGSSNDWNRSDRRNLNF
ncbi:hypothetical protein TNCV_4104561 [Trichonephila clavipes]|nr:hypothetical protein TNCV_4104561 [Trichonephila clavipes]